VESNKAEFTIKRVSMSEEKVGLVLYPWRKKQLREGEPKSRRM